MAMTITKTVEQLSDAFMGMSSFRWAKTSAKITANTAWDFECPVDKTNLSFEQGETAVDSAYIFGKSSPYGTVAGTPGEITLTLFIPSFVDDFASYFLEAVPVASKPTSVTDATHTYTPRNGYKFTTKKVSGMAMIISEDGTKCLVIKNLEGYGVMKYDPTGTTPLGFTMTVKVAGINALDTDGDVVFYDRAVTPGE